MRKGLKKIAAIISTVAIAFSVGVPAMAATADAWGNGWYTPYQATVLFEKTHVQGFNMKWDVTQIPKFINTSCWELEFRPYVGNTATNPSSIYKNTGANLVTTLPSAYYEFDTDDVSIGCCRCSDLVAEKAYSGTLYLTANPAANNNCQALIESEYGNWNAVKGDGLPLRYEQWLSNKLSFGRSASWSRK